MSSSSSIFMAIAIIAISMTIASGQITTACTSSLISSSFTPCLNFITGSTNGGGGGGSPTSGCCEALRSFLSGSSECACLILTGNVPISLPINRTLAISLPRLCKNKSVPLQCKATGTPLPSSGPVTYAPGLPPLPPFSGTGTGSGSGSVPPSSTESQIEPASSPTSQQGLNQGQRPVVVPSSATILSSSSMLMFFVLGTLLLKN